MAKENKINKEAVNKTVKNLEAELAQMKQEKAELQSSIKVVYEEISRRQKMKMDAKEYEDQLMKLDGELKPLIGGIPKKETEIHELRRSIDAAMKKERLQEYCEARLNFYQNALDKIKGKKGAKISQVLENKTMEAQIAQYSRGE